tara:strand:+ start:20 stop:538 length:519 start_codon:yes stop_codon:yes gene_type:complete
MEVKMQINKIELKNISYYEQGSEETPCYNAIVYVNGKKLIDVGNDGHGGSDRQNGYGGYSWKEVEKVDSWIKANFPKGSFESGGETHYYDYDLESWCHDKLYEHLDQKKLKRDMTRQFVCVDKAKKEVYAYAKKGNTDIQFKAHMVKNHPQDTCLNFLSFNDAWKLFDEVTS